MTDIEGQALAADLETAVREVAGVTGLFRVGGVLSNVADAGAEILGLEGARPPLVRVDTAENGWSVEIAIGVDGIAGSVETSRRVHETIHALCAARGIPFTKIQVTVAHVDESTTKD